MLFVGCLVATAILVPMVSRFARKVGAVDRGGYRKIFDGAMPLLGGLAVAAPLVVLSLLAAIASYVIVAHWPWVLTRFPDHFSIIYGFASGRGSDYLVLAVGGLGILALGLIDDTRGMRARYKLAGQVLIALFVTGFGYSITTVSVPVLGTIDLGLFLGGLVTIFWIVGLINAFNLIDGVDGLASGIALMGAGALFAISVLQGATFITFAAAALAGSLLAFLLYNFPPARIFLGDTGSMFIGFTLASLSLAGAQKAEAAIILIAPLLALSFPIFETFVSIVRRYLRGVPIFLGDNHHTHHRLLSKGYSQPRVVLTLYAVAFFLALAAILATVIPDGSPWMVATYALYGGTLAYVAWLAGYLRPTTFRRILERRRRNRVLHALGNYAKLCLTGNGRAAKTDLLLGLCRHELGLVHLEVQTAGGVRLMASTDGAHESPDERLRVKSSDDEDLFILYRYEHAPDESRHHDVTACLAAIFDHIMLDRAIGHEYPLEVEPEVIVPVLESEARRQ